MPGGVREPLAPAQRDHLKRMLPEAFDITELALNLLKDSFDQFQPEIESYGDFPSLYMGLVTPDGGLEHYNGVLRIMDSTGRILDDIDPANYRSVLGEAVEPWSYLKFPYYKPLGYEGGAGMYRVGPLARLNICDYAGTPKADRELRQFRRLGERGQPVSSSFHYHYARLIEILFCLEKIEEVLNDPELTSTRIRSVAQVNSLVGVGVSEAPRGTLFHEYHVDENGILQKVNMIIATGQNNLAMNRTVKQIAQAYVNDKGNGGGAHAQLSEGILNRIEHGIRAYDPCLSCSTHAVGQMPMHVQLLGPDGALLDEKIRD